MKRILLILPLAWLALLFWPAAADFAAQPPPLEVESAWVRQPPPGATVAAAPRCNDPAPVRAVGTRLGNVISVIAL